MDSIEQVGLQNPLKVRSRREKKDGKDITLYDLVDGRRRFTAIQRIRAKDPKKASISGLDKYSSEEGK
jgi:ParB-like chromosome segregation protein Spo0J